MKVTGISVVVARSSEKKPIMRGLREIIRPESQFWCIGIIPGLHHSVRIFSTYPIAGTVSFPNPIDSRELAEELIRLGRDEARYTRNTDKKRQKGWEIRKVKIHGTPVAIAVATWI